MLYVCGHRYIIGIRGRGLSAQASGCNQCNAGSESPESRVLDQPLCPGLLHLLLCLLHPLPWRRQNSQPQPQPGADQHARRCAGTHPHRYRKIMSHTNTHVQVLNHRQPLIQLQFYRSDTYVSTIWLPVTCSGHGKAMQILISKSVSVDIDFLNLFVQFCFILSMCTGSRDESLCCYVSSLQRAAAFLLTSHPQCRPQCLRTGTPERTCHPTL